MDLGGSCLAPAHECPLGYIVNELVVPCIVKFVNLFFIRLRLFWRKPEANTLAFNISCLQEWFSEDLVSVVAVLRA